MSRERTWPALASLAFAVGLAGQAPASGEAATVEVSAPAGPVWLGQRVEIAVRVALDRAFFADRSVPLFRRRVDVPVQLTVPWLVVNGDDAGGELLEGDGPRLAVGDRIVGCAAVGSDDRAGRAWDWFEVRVAIVGLTAGQRTLGPASVRYAYASAFEETLLGGRQPVDRIERQVDGAPLELEVRDLPGGAPAQFSGAVGEFTIEAVAGAAAVEVGDSVTITMVVRGPGNLDRFAAPPWPQWPGLAVQGLAERRDGAARVFAFDVLALSADAPPPALSFAWFSPNEADYRVIRTDPLALRVVPRAEGRPLPARVERLIAAGADRAPAGASRWGLVLGLGVLVVGVLLGLVAIRRRSASA